MNAIQFIKEKGVDKARKVVEGAPEAATSFRVLKNSKGYGYSKVNYHGVYWDKHGKWKSITICEQQTAESFKASLIDLNDLKRLVESVDLVGEYGGLYGAIDFISGYTEEQLAKPIYSPMLRLKQAIANYESIGGEHV